ncbi:hypothetical protein MKX01_008443 [Papaver californicum]|nr:hypothetical protein MKX01_008443 [Papaver californicum]
MQKNDSSKSRDSSSSMNSTIDYHTPIRTQSDVEYYYSVLSPNHKSSSSGGSSRFSSQNSSNFPPKSSISNSIYLTPPSSSSSYEKNNQITTENQLCLTRLFLLYEQLMDQYELCCGYLEDSSKKADILSQENAALLLVNKDLKNRLNLLTEVSVNHQKNQRSAYISSGFPTISIIKDFCSPGLEDNGGSTGGGGGPNTKNNNRVVPSREAPVTSPTSVFGENNKGFDEKPVQVQPERVSLPKSISIRSSAYLKMNQPNHHAGTNTAAPSSNKNTNRLRVSSTPFVPGTSPLVQLPTLPAADEGKKAGVDDQKKKEEDLLELDVYNQGMSKTELCNKWQETGVCPYGDHCQFAHGIRELRPVIRHPRYKTEVCRMVLNGSFCPYGHRCHFRHALSDQEKRTGITHS